MAERTFLLDVTRLVSRLGKGALTGIDRVELAYLRHLMQGDFALYGLMRTPAGLLLLDRRGLERLLGWVDGAALPGRLDWLGRIGRQADPVVGAIERELRGLAVLRTTVRRAGINLRKLLPEAVVYLNLGHANLSERVWMQLRDVAHFRTVAMLHDTIPLDFPQFARPDQIEAFSRRVACISRCADLVIHTSAATRRTNEAQLQRFGRVPAGITAPLGVDLAKPDFSGLPDGLLLDAPYFVTIGTIEPRKNHALLLDLWERISAELASPPTLYVIGNRGWAGPELFARLDRAPKAVRVLSGLNDAAVAALLGRSRGLLFPSFAEGYGLPAFEAAAMGVRVIASDLPVLRECLGDYPVYLPPDEIYSWQKAILDPDLQNGHEGVRKMPRATPSWDDHLRYVLTTF